MATDSAVGRGRGPNVGSRRPSLATATVLGIGGAALIPLAAVAPAMGSLTRTNLRGQTVTATENLVPPESFWKEN
jgi:hypothetical protein